jgi:hypothetical protein
VLAVLALGSAALAITIDDFSVGATTVDGPNAESQSLLDPLHVVGGNRDIVVEREGFRAQVETLKGRFHFTPTSSGALGYYQLMYGLNEPLNVDFTAGGHDRIRFRFVDGGQPVTLWTYVNSQLPPTSSNVGIASAVRAIHGSGVVEVPFALYAADFAHVTSFAIWDVRVSSGYHIEEIVTAGPPLPGDYNRDGLVDAYDYTEWKRMFGGKVSGGILVGADGNEDGVVDAADYTVWRDNFGASAAGLGASAGNIPEPSTGSLATFVFLLVARAAKRWGRCSDWSVPRS